jgi:hypothetical protein
MSRRAKLSKSFSGAFFIVLGLFFVREVFIWEADLTMSDRQRDAEVFVCGISGLLFILAGTKLLYDARHMTQQSRCTEPRDDVTVPIRTPRARGCDPRR